MHLAAPSAFVQPAAAAGAMGVAPDAMDAQIALARIFPVIGGKFETDRQLIMPIPAEEGFTDQQVATSIVVAGVILLAAVDLGRTLYNGFQPSQDPKVKGDITPLVKRIIENGQ